MEAFGDRFEKLPIGRKTNLSPKSSLGEEGVYLGETSLGLAAALEVEVEQRRALGLHDAHLDGLLGGDDEATALALELPQLLALRIVAVGAGA